MHGVPLESGGRHPYLAPSEYDQPDDQLVRLHRDLEVSFLYMIASILFPLLHLRAHRGLPCLVILPSPRLDPEEKREIKKVWESNDSPSSPAMLVQSLCNLRGEDCIAGRRSRIAAISSQVSGPGRTPWCRRDRLPARCPENRASCYRRRKSPCPTDEVPTPLDIRTGPVSSRGTHPDRPIPGSAVFREAYI